MFRYVTHSIFGTMKLCKVLTWYKMKKINVTAVKYKTLQRYLQNWICNRFSPLFFFFSLSYVSNFLIVNLNKEEFVLNNIYFIFTHIQLLIGVLLQFSMALYSHFNYKICEYMFEVGEFHFIVRSGFSSI